ncbi:MAG: hypothetical protein ACUVTL_03435 [Thermoproteota archaeon]
MCGVKKAIEAVEELTGKKELKHLLRSCNRRENSQTYAVDRREQRDAMEII